MPRRIRAWEPGAIFHVDARAHSGAPIFSTDADRAFVVDRAARVFREEGVECFAWAVLINHFHLLVRFPGHPKRPMQRLNTGLAMRARRLAGGEGAVFQDRYFGRPCPDSGAVLTRLAYVTANPIHHRIVPSVRELADHPWSSLGEVIGRRPALLSHPAGTLALLDAPRGQAVAGFIDLLERRVRGWEADDAGRTVERTPGDDAPMACEGPAPADGHPADPRGRTVPSSWDAIIARRDLLLARRWTPDALIEPACLISGADPVGVRSGSRDHASTRARSIVAHIACNALGWPTGDVGRAIALSPSAVVRARMKGPGLIETAGVSATDLLRSAGALP